MIYYKTDIYIYGKKKKLCTALFETKNALDNFTNTLDNNNIDVIKLGNVVFKRKDFYYAIINEKRIRQ